MPVANDSWLFYHCTHLGFTAYAIALGHSYFQASQALSREHVQCGGLRVMPEMMDPFPNPSPTLSQPPSPTLLLTHGWPCVGAAPGEPHAPAPRGGADGAALHRVPALRRARDGGGGGVRRELCRLAAAPSDTQHAAWLGPTWIHPLGPYPLVPTFLSLLCSR